MALRYLLDTDICSYILRYRPAKARRRFDVLPAGSTGVPVIAYGELCFGAALSSDSTAALANIDALVTIAPVVPLPTAAAGIYATLRATLQKQGQAIGANDLWIAAHALAARTILVTNNEREFRRVPGLRLQNWVK
jgi:tRNA(fMet)-specific endonuclease VapC